jgi:hypothetical protein
LEVERDNLEDLSRAIADPAFFEMRV